MARTAVAADGPDPEFHIDKIPTRTIRVPIEGTTSLIVHRFAAKAKTIMLDSQQGRKAPKAARDPEEDFDNSMYRLADGDGTGMPLLAFKLATVSAARFYTRPITMAALRQFLFFTGGVLSNDGTDLLYPIVGEPKMREDVVRINNGRGTDLRFRAEYPEWSTVLQVTFATPKLSTESVLSLIDAGGLGVGVGEWRPEKSGQNGTYRIPKGADIRTVPNV